MRYDNHGNLKVSLISFLELWNLKFSPNSSLQPKIHHLKLNFLAYFATLIILSFKKLHRYIACTEEFRNTLYKTSKLIQLKILNIFCHDYSGRIIRLESMWPNGYSKHIFSSCFIHINHQFKKAVVWFSSRSVTLQCPRFDFHSERAKIVLYFVSPRGERGEYFVFWFSRTQEMPSKISFQKILFLYHKCFLFSRKIEGPCPLCSHVCVGLQYQYKVMEIFRAMTAKLRRQH